MTKKRREFLKAAGTAAVASLAVKGSSGHAQTKVNPSAVPLNQVAVLPDGSKLGRAEILQRLGLDPNTPPDAWLSIYSCGTNGAALKPSDAESLFKRNIIDARTLEQIRKRGVVMFLTVQPKQAPR